MIKTSKIKQVIALSEIENFSSLNAIFGFQLQETDFKRIAFNFEGKLYT